MITNPGFGERVRLLRKRLLLSKAELGRLLTTSEFEVAQWEQGSVPTRKILLRISNFFGETPDWLLTGKESEGFRLARHELWILTALENLPEEDRREACERMCYWLGHLVRTGERLTDR
jgi:transcriptional regulator with XRE-family HTH domain